MDSNNAGSTATAVKDRSSNTGRRRGTLSTRLLPSPVAERRGPAASMLRDSLFRRALLAADALAIVGALLLTAVLSPRSQQLPWSILLALPILLVGTKLLGLYDRDETLLRKTTLDEAPKLFQVATLCALVSWLTGGLIVSGNLDRHEALFLWLALAALLVLARTIARTLALRIAPVERCLFIGDEQSATTICAKLSGHGGGKAKVVAHLDPHKAPPSATDTLS